MKKVYKYKEKRHLHIGDYYEFTILKQVSIPNEGTFFILCDPFGYKHLLASKYYQEYNFTINKKITCRVDKVNCQGRIFFEPVHPVYTIGKSYQFRYTGETKTILQQGNKMDYFVMEGLSGYPAFLTKDINRENSMLIEWENYLVINIKKARVYITST